MNWSSKYFGNGQFVAWEDYKRIILYDYNKKEAKKHQLQLPSNWYIDSFFRHTESLVSLEGFTKMWSEYWYKQCGLGQWLGRTEYNYQCVSSCSLCPSSAPKSTRIKIHITQNKLRQNHLWMLKYIYNGLYSIRLLQVKNLNFLPKFYGMWRFV